MRNNGVMESQKIRVILIKKRDFWAAILPQMALKWHGYLEHHLLNALLHMPLTAPWIPDCHSPRLVLYLVFLGIRHFTVSSSCSSMIDFLIQRVGSFSTYLLSCSGLSRHGMTSVSLAGCPSSKSLQFKPIPQRILSLQVFRIQSQSVLRNHCNC